MRAAAARRRAFGALLLWAGSAAAAAVDAPKPGWTVLHCGVAKGVLYLTYAENGHAAITPAVDNGAVRQACARAGHPIDGPPPAGAARSPVSVLRTPADTPAAVPAPSRVEPHFTAQAIGSSLGVDGRNDGAVSQSCLVRFTWTWQGNRDGPRSSSTQVTLPGRQINRVVTLTAPGPGAQIVSAPQSVCRPVE